MMELVTQKYPYEEHKILNSVPRFLLEMNEEFEFYIAGGMITSIFTDRDINDIDIYLKKYEDLEPFIGKLMGSCFLISATNKSTMFKYTSKGGTEFLINLIYFDFFEKSEDIFECFDFTCVMGLYDVRGEKFIFHKDFLVHNAQKRLMFNKDTKYPLMSMFRVRKYVDRAYSISKNEYLRMLLRCMTLDINSYDELEDHIGGMYGLQLDLVMDTSIPFDLSTVIDQISDVIHDIDFETTVDNYVKIAKQENNLYNVLTIHRLLRSDKTFTKISYNEVTLLLDEGIVSEVVTIKTPFLDTIPNYEGTLIRAYGKTLLKKDGHLTVEVKGSLSTKPLSDFFKDNLNVVKLYSSEYISKEISDYPKYSVGLFEFDIKDVQNVDEVMPFSPLRGENSIEVRNITYKDSLLIEVPEKNKKIPTKMVDKVLIDRIYDERINKLSNKTRLEKIKMSKIEKSLISKLKEVEKTTINV